MSLYISSGVGENNRMAGMEQGMSDTAEDGEEEEEEDEDEDDGLDDGYEIDDEFAETITHNDARELDELNDNVIVNEDHVMNRMDQPLL